MTVQTLGEFSRLNHTDKINAQAPKNSVDNDQTLAMEGGN